MYAQIGNIIFEGLLGFDSFESKQAATYAQHDVINGKPVLVPTGNELEEISISIRLRAEFVKPEEAILELKKSREAFEVLPLVKGSGRYLGDFVITEISVTDTQALADGTTVEATVELSLKEYATSDKLQQQQASARQNAFATGDKKPLSMAAKQPNTTAQLASQDLVAANSQGAAIDNSIDQYETNVSQQQNISDHIQKALGKMDAKLSAFNDKISNIPLLKNVSDIAAAVASVKGEIQNFSFPITSIDDLKLNNRNLQQVLRSLSRTAITLSNLVITRAA
jgi:phage protein U